MCIFQTTKGVSKSVEVSFLFFSQMHTLLLLLINKSGLQIIGSAGADEVSLHLFAQR